MDPDDVETEGRGKSLTLHSTVATFDITKTRIGNPLVLPPPNMTPACPPPRFRSSGFPHSLGPPICHGMTRRSYQGPYPNSPLRHQSPVKDCTVTPPVNQPGLDLLPGCNKTVRQHLKQFWRLIVSPRLIVYYATHSLNSRFPARILVSCYDDNYSMEVGTVQPEHFIHSSCATVKGDRRP